MRITPLLLLLSACAIDPELPELDDTSQDLRIFNHVANPNPRPEIGLWGGPGHGCTATLIRPNWAIMAAHCWGWFDGRMVPGVPSTFEVFNTLADGTTITQSVATDRTFGFTHFTGEIGGNDVMIAHLTASPSIPAGIVPATIATTQPANGLSATDWGLGCTSIDGPGFGTLRAMDTTTGATTNTLCEGDSGGPKVTGTWTARGPIYAINSFRGGADGFGNPVSWKASIDAVISRWDTYGSYDIYKNGWCTGANERRYELDANGDGQVDALCWNKMTGAESLAIGTNRLITPGASAATTFCVGTNKELLVGDFDGDRKSDLLCHDKTTGANTIDLGSDFYYGVNITEPVTGWCSHSTGQLFVGDFDGNGVSDLLCHDTATGHKWFDKNYGSGFFDGVTDYESSNNFCSHVGAKMIVGDVDGNGYTDLICHTPMTGQIHLDRTYYNDKFNGVDFTLDPTSGLAFCASGRVEVGDYDGDGRSDLKCVTPNGTFWSLWADSAGTFSYNAGRTFGFGGDIAQRTVNSTSRPWTFER